jgi:hypothetical protein
MNRPHYGLVLAFYPHARGFSYVVLEETFSLVDWGMSDLPAKGRAQVSLRRLAQLLDRYRPNVLLLRAAQVGMATQTSKLLKIIEDLAVSRGIDAATISRNQIRQAFAYLGSPNRYAIAQAIAGHMPMLAPYVPPVRKIWNGEDRRMGLFDAAALALTFFQGRETAAETRRTTSRRPVRANRRVD